MKTTENKIIMIMVYDMYWYVRCKQISFKKVLSIKDMNSIVNDRKGLQIAIESLAENQGHHHQLTNFCFHHPHPLLLYSLLEL